MGLMEMAGGRESHDVTDENMGTPTPKRAFDDSSHISNPHVSEPMKSVTN